MNQFLSLKDGTIINLNAIAYIDADSTPTLDPADADVRIVFPAAWADIGGSYQALEMILEGEQAEEFLTALKDRGVDVEQLRAARKAGGFTVQSND
jgi:hypothetical protein